MKRKLFILAFLLCALTLISDYAMADFYVIAGGRRVGTEIKSLPYTISSPGFYYIAGDLSCAAVGHGITINADNVTLDLMGFSLVGPGGSADYDGICMFAKTNVEIRNGTVRNFPRKGIYEGNAGGTGHRIINIRAKDNGNNTGIAISGKSHIVEGCTAVGNGGHGIYAGYGSTVTGNTCYDNDGRGIDTGSGSTVTGNTCYDNDGKGIQTGTGSTVTGNTCYSSGERGIQAGSGSTVTGNTCHGNTGDGIFAYGGSTVTGNTCYENGNDGIFADGGSTVTGNTCRNNTGYGIHLGGNNLVDQNTAYNNTTANMNVCGTCTFGTNHAPPPPP